MKTTKPLTLRSLRSLLKRRFGGVIKRGSHSENGECCALELASVAKGLEWTDSPTLVRFFDLRPLNDIQVSDALRTEWMPKLLVAYDGSLDWSESKRRKIVSSIVVGMFNRIISDLPGLSEEIRNQCRQAATLSECRVAALAAQAPWAALAPEAAWAAWADAAARAAARAASAWARRDRVFITACKIWLEAAEAPT